MMITVMIINIKHDDAMSQMTEGPALFRTGNVLSERNAVVVMTRDQLKLIEAMISPWDLN